MDLDTRINLFGIFCVVLGYFLGQWVQYVRTKEQVEHMKHEIVQNRDIIDEMMGAYWNGTAGGKNEF